MFAGAITCHLACREQPTEGWLRSVAQEYLDDWANRRWTETYKREWFRYAPQVEISLEECAAYMDNLWNRRAPEDRHMRIVSIDVQPDGTGTVVVAGTPKKPAITDPGLLIEQFADDAEIIRTLTRPNVLEIQTTWAYRQDDHRWVLPPTRATTDQAPWLDRILLQHNLPILADWPTIASWDLTGCSRDLRFSIERGTWCATWSCEKRGHLISLSVRDSNGDIVGIGGDSAGKNRGHTTISIEPGEFFLNASADDECHYRIEIRSVDRLPEPSRQHRSPDDDEWITGCLQRRAARRPLHPCSSPDTQR